MANILCVLYDDPVDGYPPAYARDDVPRLTHYPGGQTTPTPQAIDFRPGQLLGSVSGELGLRHYLESAGHELVVTSDKDGYLYIFNLDPDGEMTCLFQTTATFGLVQALHLSELIAAFYREMARVSAGQTPTRGRDATGDGGAEVPPAASGDVVACDTEVMA